MTRTPEERQARIRELLAHNEAMALVLRRKGYDMGNKSAASRKKSEDFQKIYDVIADELDTLLDQEYGAVLA